ncbi:IclR family transcriptional regulator [Gracilibacillus alcaliphilus]|uniref:IclR family transcriptional regulator n=1 Tax=Gracilibacillus alcaliphilus TaxID=1401441 RepID=UPI00195E1B94|nr:IclR family transcriptional regulator [Gracilibacillus alcaliphilus]MBM7679026.1 DNA-binding IclR family transcriptional regulator [Gracilibacillus alcaliphilus]
MKKYSVPALEKAIAILSMIATRNHKTTVTEIHKHLELSKATVFTILNVLESYDMVKKNKQGEYEIGVKLYELGMSYMSKIDLASVAKPYMEELMECTGCTVHLGVLDEGKVLYVAKEEPDTFIKFSTFPGLKSDFHITSLGKAIAAYMDEEKVDEILSAEGLPRHTDKTVTDINMFKQALKEIKKAGYALEDEEGELGVRCIGAPIFSHKDESVIGAVSIANHTSRLQFDVSEDLIRQVQATAKAISRNLGSV